MFLSKGLYRHQSSGQIVKVMGIGRRVEIPHKQVIIYEADNQIWVKDLDNEVNLVKLNQKIIK